MIHQADKELKQKWREAFNSLPEDAKLVLRDALKALREDSLRKAEHSWKKHKAPMALYWKVVGVYAGHLARSIDTKKAT